MNTRQQSRDIIVLNANLKGTDFVIGDVHGSSEELHAILSLLDVNDRLFMVGDLVDKGLNSPGVINFIVAHDEKRVQKGLPPQVYSVRGNHEVMCLNAIESIEKGAMTATNLPDYMNLLIEESLLLPELAAVSLHISNGGMWLVDLFKKECESRQISLSTDGIQYTDESEIKKIKNYITQLPYIYNVSEHLENGIIGFNVVHADLPFDDDQMKKRLLNDNVSLSDAEIRYVVWARDLEHHPSWDVPMISDGCFGRRLTYVGHTIVGYENLEQIIRPRENVINLDGGLYSRRTALMVNHTHLQARAIISFRGRTMQNLTPEYKAVIKVINHHLNLQLTMELMVAITYHSAYGLQLIDYLVAAGASPNQLIYVHEFNSYLEPLSVATGIKNVPALIRLFELGANPSANNNIALVNAVRSSRKDIVAMFLKRPGIMLDLHAEGDGYTVLHEAAECNDTEIVKMLLDAGATASVKDDVGNTPMQLTLKNEIKIMLEHHHNVKQLLDLDDLARQEYIKQEVIQDAMVQELVRAKPIDMESVTTFLSVMRLQAESRQAHSIEDEDKISSYNINSNDLVFKKGRKRSASFELEQLNIELDELTNSSSLQRSPKLS